MRNWKISIEVGGSGVVAQENLTTNILPSHTTTVHHEAREKVWDTLKDARRKLASAITSHDAKQVELIPQWIGGGLAALAVLTDEDPQALLKSLEQAVPVGLPIVPLPPLPGGTNPTQDGQPYFRVMTDYVPPPRHPGAPKPLDYSSLSEEEREQLGIIIKSQAPEGIDVEVVAPGSSE